MDITDLRKIYISRVMDMYYKVNNIFRFLYWDINGGNNNIRISDMSALYDADDSISIELERIFRLDEKL